MRFTTFTFLPDFRSPHFTVFPAGAQGKKREFVTRKRRRPPDPAQSRFDGARAQKSALFPYLHRQDASTQNFLASAFDL